MKDKTAEFLFILLWSCEQLLYPSWRRAGHSYESWLYSKGFLQQLHRWQKMDLIELKLNEEREPIYRLTEIGRIAAAGGRDPEAYWNRSWDGKWRQVFFDISVNQRSTRDKLRYFLRRKRFGCLQKSVWITPDALPTEGRFLQGTDIPIKSLSMFEGWPAGGGNDSVLVQAAWNFERINDRYTQYLEWLAKNPEPGGAKAKLVRHWASSERGLWSAAFQLDPLLPARLLPANYMGRKAWQERKKVLNQTRKCLENADS